MQVAVEHRDVEENEAHGHESGDEQRPQRAGDESVAAEEEFVAKVIDVARITEESSGVEVACVFGIVFPKMARKLGAGVQVRAEDVENGTGEREVGGLIGVGGAKRGEDDVDQNDVETDAEGFAPAEFASDKVEGAEAESEEVKNGAGEDKRFSQIGWGRIGFEKEL